MKKCFILLIISCFLFPALAQELPGRREFISQLDQLDSLVVTDWQKLAGQKLNAKAENTYTITFYAPDFNLPGCRSENKLIKTEGIVNYVCYQCNLESKQERNEVIDVLGTYKTWIDLWAYNTFDMQAEESWNDTDPEHVTGESYWMGLRTAKDKISLSLFYQEPLWKLNLSVCRY